MASRSLWMLRSRTRNFSFIAELPRGLHRPCDRSHPRPEIDVPLERLLQDPPERSLHFDVVTVDRHVYVGIRPETARLEDRPEEMNGPDRREAGGRQADSPSRLLQHPETELLLLSAEIPVPLGVVLAVGIKRGCVHHVTVYPAPRTARAARSAPAPGSRR